MREGLRPPAGRPAAVLRRNQVYTSLRLCPRYILSKFHYNRTKGLAVIVRQTDRQTSEMPNGQVKTGPHFVRSINNLPKLQLSGRIYLFADDTLIFITGVDWEEVRNKANRDVMLVKSWFNQNVLSLNTSKTKFMPISLTHLTDYNLQNIIIHDCGNHMNLTCKCENIEKVLSFKYLGVIFDCRMKWTEHINHLKKRLRKYIYVFRQLSYILDEQEVKL